MSPSLSDYGSSTRTGGTTRMPRQSDAFYTELIDLISNRDGKQATQKILELKTKYDQVYAVSRLYKGIYPYIDKAIELNPHTDLETILETVEANAFLFDLSLSIIDKTDLALDIRSDLQHAVTLKRMLAHAFKEAIDLDYALTDELMVELDNARTVLQAILHRD
jgi:hypothetical protein